MDIARRTFTQIVAAAAAFPHWPSMSSMNYASLGAQDAAAIVRIALNIKTGFLEAQGSLNDLPYIVRTYRSANRELFPVSGRFSRDGGKTWISNADYQEQQREQERQELTRLVKELSPINNDLESLLESQISFSVRRALAVGRAFYMLGHIVLTDDPHRQDRVIQALEKVILLKKNFYITEINKLVPRYLSDDNDAFRDSHSLNELKGHDSFAQYLKRKRPDSWLKDPLPANYVIERETRFQAMRSAIAQIADNINLDISIIDAFTDVELTDIKMIGSVHSVNYEGHTIRYTFGGKNTQLCNHLGNSRMFFKTLADFVGERLSTSMYDLHHFDAEQVARKNGFPSNSIAVEDIIDADHCALAMRLQDFMQTKYRRLFVELFPEIQVGTSEAPLPTLHADIIRRFDRFNVPEKVARAGIEATEDLSTQTQRSSSVREISSKFVGSAKKIAGKLSGLTKLVTPTVTSFRASSAAPELHVPIEEQKVLLVETNAMPAIPLDSARQKSAPVPTQI